MPRLIIFILCNCILVSCLAGVHAQVLDDTVRSELVPHASFSEMIWDFGTIKQGEKVAHTFTISNTGSAELLIESIRTSCGCTAVTPGKKNLAPGESTFLETTFDSTGRDGEQHKNVYIMTNDPLQKMYELTIRGTITIPAGPRISYEPSMWDFGLQEIDATPATNIVITNEGFGDLEITRLQTSHLYSARLTPDAPIPAGKEAVITISFFPLKTPGVVETYLNMCTNDTTKPNIPLRILGYVKGTLPPSIVVAPMEWDFGVVYKEVFEAVQTSFYIRNSGDENLVVQRLKIPDGFESDTTTPLTIAPSKEAEISFRLAKPFQLGTVQQYLFVYSNDPQHPARRVSIYGYIAEHTKD